MDLNNAEIAVTTQHLIDIKDYRDYWLHLSATATWASS